MALIMKYLQKSLFYKWKRDIASSLVCNSPFISFLFAKDASIDAIDRNPSTSKRPPLLYTGSHPDSRYRICNAGVLECGPSAFILFEGRID